VEIQHVDPLNPTDFAAYSIERLCFIKKAEYNQVISDCVNAIRLNPKNLPALCQPGQRVLKKG
jgi:hypothetical protein